MTIHVNISTETPEEFFSVLSKLLTGTAVSSGNVVGTGSVKQAIEPSSDGPETSAQDAPESAGNGPIVTTDASPSDVELDTDGWPWSADMHASTKGKNADGRWKMKKGVARPDPKPGFPVTDAGAAAPTAEATSVSADVAGTGTASDADDDEFAAFREAAAASEAVAPEVPARTWTDADLSKLCNQVAQKIGGDRVGEIKEMYLPYMPEGVVPHSRNIPEDRREEFAQAMEEKFEVQFAG